MLKNVLTCLIVLFAFFAVDFKAVGYKERRLWWVWTSKSPSTVMLLARWSLVVSSIFYFLAIFGVFPLPTVVFGVVGTFIHIGAMTYLDSEAPDDT